MLDDIGLCNLALSRIGVTITISSLSERSKEAITCNQVFSTVRDRVLMSAPWPFAKKQVLLQLTGTAPAGWSYRYAYPTDCLKVRNIFNLGEFGLLDAAALRRYYQTHKGRFEIILDGSNQKTICTDIETATIEYTVRLINPVLWPSDFDSAFAWALAAEIAIPLAKGIDFSRNAAQNYQFEINQVLADTLNEEGREDQQLSKYEEARL